jgi:uncharacterized protein YkwD
MVTRRSILQAITAGALPRAGAATINTRDFARRVFRRINELRVQSGASALEWSDAVAECARQQSVRKVELRFPGHIDPARGDVAQRLNTAGISWMRCGENIFMERGWEDPVNYAAVFWWYSPGHKANLLDPDFTATGVGLAQATDKTWFVTQIFVEPPAPKVRGRHG